MEENDLNQITEIKIRRATAQDRDFIIALVPRLTEFQLPSWRNAEQMNRVDERILSRVLLESPAESAIFVAEDENQTPLGFIHLKVAQDFYNAEQNGHISDIIVAPEGEGRGVGKALMKAGEDWAQNLGFKWLTLNVFGKNERARNLYEKMGYGEDMIRYFKEL